jgi:hypothetical protein
VTPRDAEAMVGAILARLASEPCDASWLVCRAPCQVAKLANVGKRSRAAIAATLDPRVMCPACALRETLFLAEASAAALAKRCGR